MNGVSRVCELRQRKRLESESAPNALQTTMRKVCPALNACSLGSSARKCQCRQPEGGEVGGGSRNAKVPVSKPLQEVQRRGNKAATRPMADEEEILSVERTLVESLKEWWHK